MKIVSEGDTIGTCKCDGCGEECAVKVNKNLCVYYYCTKLTGVIKVNKKGVAQQERCFTRMAYGRTASIKIIENFTKEQHNHVENHPEQTDTAEHVSTPAAGTDDKPTGKRGGLLGAIEHFVTG